MSAETPAEDGEIHDLVLLFANSKIPRGSDAFQTLIDDFLKHDDDDATDTVDGVVASDSSDSSAKEPETVLTGKLLTPLPKSALKSKGKSVRLESPKPLTHVHWPDEENSKLASSPATEQLHHARIFMKTTPKPILKHEEPVLVADNSDKAGFRRFSSPSHI